MEKNFGKHYMTNIIEMHCDRGFESLSRLKNSIVTERFTS